MLSFVRGDMFECPADIRVNTVNCVGVMGAGVALAMKNRYPEMFAAYKRACEAGRVKPGEMDVWRTLTEWIINFPTKRHWRDKSRYEDIDAGLIALRDYLAKLGKVRVTLPALGCGHGGLDWARVSLMIHHRLDDLDAQIFVFEPADSIAAGAQTASQGGPEFCALTEDAPEFSSQLSDLGIRQVYVMGETTVLRRPWLVIACSSKPDEREAIAASACVEAIAGNGVTLALLHGGKLSRNLSETALERGAGVVLWAAEGIRKVRLAHEVSKFQASGKVTVISLAKPDERWYPGGARRSLLAATALARAVLVTDPKADWIAGAITVIPTLPAFFYIRYAGAEPEADERLRRIGAKPIGKRAAGGTPNISPILSSMEVSAQAS